MHHSHTEPCQPIASVHCAARRLLYAISRIVQAVQIMKRHRLPLTDGWLTHWFIYMKYWFASIVSFQRSSVYSVIGMAEQTNHVLNMSDGDDGEWSLQDSCDLYIFVVYTLIVGIIVIVGIVGNCFTAFVFWKGDFGTSTSFLFLCLSLIDSALLLTVLPLYSLYPLAYYTGRLEKEIGAIRPYVTVYILPLAWLTQTATLWVTVLIAVNRYIIVCLPFRAAQWCTASKVRIQLGIVLVFAILYNIPRFATYRLVHVVSNNGTTHTAYAGYSKLGSNELYHVIYGNVLYMIFMMVLPISILIVLTIRLITAMNAHRRLQSEMRTQHNHRHDDTNVTFVLVIVVIVVIACQLPALVNQVLWNVFEDEARQCGRFQFYLRPIANMLVILNSAVNFIIYTLFNKSFRDVLIKNVCMRG